MKHIILCLLKVACFNLTAQNILLFEDFESGDFAAKGWYDGFDDQRTDDEYKNGNYSYEGHFALGAKTSGAGRHLFPPTDKVYMSYWVKYSANYIGSGVGYHPHEWNILTTEDWAYQGPADTYLTLYIEQNAGRPILAIQDSKNVDPDCILLNNNSFVGCNGNFNTYPFTENRSVSSCNGLAGYVDRRDCFPSSGSSHGYYSARGWDADSVYFRDEEGAYYKNDWHFIEAYFELNTIENNIGIPNGKIRYWYDGQLLITSDSILLRTAAHPDMKFNQLFYGPYIGVGSPVDQTWWIDDLTIADGLPITGTTEDDHQCAIQIFPNPNSGSFRVDFGNENCEILTYISLFDIMGKKLLHEPINSFSQMIDSGLPRGIYYIIPENSSGLLRPLKVVIQ